MGYIYKITNDINKKVYIGQTIKTVNYRFKEHLRTAKNHYENKQTLTHFHKAIIKYGAEHFFVETIEECDDNLLDEREIYWINYYDSFLNGYNSTTGGQFAPQSKGQMVIQYSITGEYIHLFENARKAALAVNGNENSIRDACGGRRKSSADYQWRYFEENFPLQIEPLIYDHSSHGGAPTKPVIQFDKRGNIINHFSSIESAAQATGIKRGNIGRACNEEGVSTAGGYQWRFLNSKDIPIDLIGEVEIKEPPKTKKEVIQYTKKEHKFIKEWDSIYEASNSLNIRSCLIINNCEGQQKSAGGYYWEYKI